MCYNFFNSNLKVLNTENKYNIFKKRSQVSITLIGIKASLSKIANFLMPVVVFFFDPNQGKLLLALLALIALDTLIGSYYYYNVGQSDKKKFLKGWVSKFFKYFGAVAAARLLEYFLVGIPYADQLDTYVLAFLAITEFKSFYGWLIKFGLKIPVPPKVAQVLEDATKK